MNGNHENWKIHMVGLQQMVRVRGGLQAFDSNPLVQNKIHRWVHHTLKPSNLSNLG